MPTDESQQNHFTFENEIAISRTETTHNDRVQSGVVTPGGELPERARLESVLRRVTLSGDTAATRVR